MKWWARVAAIFVALVLIPGRSTAEEWKLARLAFGSGWEALPAVVAIERGFFAQEGIVVSGLAATSAEAVVRSVEAGTTDFAVIPQRTLLVMAALQLPVKVIAMTSWGTEMELVVPKDETSVKSIADLKGKTIALTVGSEAFPVLIRLLNKAKLRPGDVSVKYLPAADLVRAFQGPTKVTDAVFESRHFTSTLTKTDRGRVVLAAQDVVRDLGVIAAQPVITTKAVIDREPALVQKFVTAWVKALKYIQQDPEDAARLLVIFFHRQGSTVPADLARSWVGMTRYTRYIWTAADVADAEYNGWALKEGGIFKVQPKLDGYVESRYAEEALKRLEASSGGSSGGPGPADR